jgi:hypothetical protein
MRNTERKISFSTHLLAVLRTPNNALFSPRAAAFAQCFSNPCAGAFSSVNLLPESLAVTPKLVDRNLPYRFTMSNHRTGLSLRRAAALKGGGVP